MLGLISLALIPIKWSFKNWQMMSQDYDATGSCIIKKRNRKLWINFNRRKKTRKNSLKYKE